MNSDTPTDVPAKSPTRYALNDGFTRLLDQAEAVNNAASDDQFKAALTARGITPAITDAQKADIARGRALLQTTKAGRHAGESATGEKSAERNKLQILIGQIQSAALQKDLLDDTNIAANYYVGADIENANTGQLQAVAEGIVEQLQHDDLPGVTQADEDAYEAAVEAWESEIEQQRTAKAAPQDDQRELETLIAKIKRYKQATQLAADAQWPFNQTNSDGQRINHVTRGLFELPVSRKYRPAKRRG